jgi:hypothetical protein
MLVITVLLLLFTASSVQASPADAYLDVIKLQHVDDVVNRYETVNISLTLINIYDEPLRNITFSDEYNNELLYIQDSTNKTLEYNETTAEVSYHLPILNPGEKAVFWTLLNITTNSSQLIPINPSNITYYVDYGIPVTVYSNTVKINFEYRPGDIEEGLETRTRIEGEMALGMIIPLAGIFLPVVLAVVAYRIGRKSS